MKKIALLLLYFSKLLLSSTVTIEYVHEKDSQNPSYMNVVLGNSHETVQTVINYNQLSEHKDILKTESNYNEGMLSAYIINYELTCIQLVLFQMITSSCMQFIAQWKSYPSSTLYTQAWCKKNIPTHVDTDLTGASFISICDESWNELHRLPIDIENQESLNHYIVSFDDNKRVHITPKA